MQGRFLPGLKVTKSACQHRKMNKYGVLTKVCCSKIYLFWSGISSLDVQCKLVEFLANFLTRKRLFFCRNSSTSNISSAIDTEGEYTRNWSKEIVKFLPSVKIIMIFVLLIIFSCTWRNGDGLITFYSLNHLQKKNCSSGSNGGRPATVEPR